MSIIQQMEELKRANIEQAKVIAALTRERNNGTTGELGMTAPETTESLSSAERKNILEAIHSEDIQTDAAKVQTFL